MKLDVKINNLHAHLNLITTPDMDIIFDFNMML